MDWESYLNGNFFYWLSEIKSQPVALFQNHRHRLIGTLSIGLTTYLLNMWIKSVFLPLLSQTQISQLNCLSAGMVIFSVSQFAAVKIHLTRAFQLLDIILLQLHYRNYVLRMQWLKLIFDLITGFSTWIFECNLMENKMLYL